MVCIFRITKMYRSKIIDQRLYQSKVMFDKWWKNSIASGAFHDQRIEYIAEELINNKFVEIDRWNNGVL